jgi:hypothetical protein
MRLYSHPGNDLTSRPSSKSIARLRSRSCIIDGEAAACDDSRSVSRASCQARSSPHVRASRIAFELNGSLRVLLTADEKVRPPGCSRVKKSGQWCFEQWPEDSRFRQVLQGCSVSATNERPELGSRLTHAVARVRSDSAPLHLRPIRYRRRGGPQSRGGCL